MGRLFVILLLPFILSCIFLCGCCSLPRVNNYEQLYSFSEKKEKGTGMFGSASKTVTIEDFRKNEMYREDIAALKERVEKYISTHNDLSERGKNNLRELKVTKGATEEEVELLLGRPDRIILATTWVYKINKSATFSVIFLPIFFGHEKYYLYFKDNALAAIERHYLKQVFKSNDSGMGLSGSRK